MNPEIPIIKRREIEARVIKPIFEEMVAKLGREAAISILESAIKRDAIAHGKSSGSPKMEQNDMSAFVKLYELWTAEDALEIDVIEQTDQSFKFNVTGCLYAKMYRNMGIADLGSVLSCGRDKHFCGGFNPNLQLERTQTIMRGADFCDFHYNLPKDDKG